MNVRIKWSKRRKKKAYSIKLFLNSRLHFHFVFWISWQLGVDTEIKADFFPNDEKEILSVFRLSSVHLVTFVVRSGEAL